MKFIELKKRAHFYKPVLKTDAFIPVTVRRFVYKIFSFIFFTFLATYIIFSLGSYDVLYGIILILISAWLAWSAWEMFYNALNARDPHKTLVTPLVAELVIRSSKRDVTKSFLYSKVGKECIRRFGISKKEVKTYIRSSRDITSSQDLFFNEGAFVDLAVYAKALIDRDTGFREFLFRNVVSEESLLDLCQWMERRFYLNLQKQRWWTRDALMRVPSIGAVFSFGHSYVLESFARKVEPAQGDVLIDYFEEDLEKIEDILVRAREANALILGSRENHKMISLLQGKIQKGGVHPEIEHKNLFVLDVDDLMSTAKNKAGFEQTLIKLLKDAEHAGNIILVLYDLPRFVLSAQSLGVAVMPILEPYLVSSNLQVIAFSEMSEYHKVLESNEIVQQRFEPVAVAEKQKEIIRTLVENHIATIEKSTNIFFEYASIDAIANGIERYFTSNSPLDEIADTLIDLTQKVSSLGKRVITKEDVLRLFESKTGIPLQKAGNVEKEKLIHLEDFLHQRVVGQETAVAAISDALRRVRSGISNPDRPIGTFLFLGPTGVGKTETVKALAESFFGGENHVQRLDMSEFSSQNALSRLIGSFETGEVGVLSAKLRENPYGILLLDEFEKATTEVHDLFLQILDEGLFSDMNGDKVNVRNTIIIATSNAGSHVIRKYLQEGQDIEEHTGDIVQSIIDEGVFKPELINRFDAVVAFHPLEKEHTTKIADIMMQKLAERLEKKGVKVSLSQDALEYIVEKGTSSDFGARELNRVLQDKVEGAVAQMMLEDRVQQGDTITLTRADIE